MDLGLDGVDIDVEGREGDLVACAAVLQRVVDHLLGAGVPVTFSPQLVRPSLQPLPSAFENLITHT